MRSLIWLLKLKKLIQHVELLCGGLGKVEPSHSALTLYPAGLEIPAWGLGLGHAP